MLRALAGLIKVIKVINVIKKLDKCLGGNMFSAEAKKKKEKVMALALLSAVIGLAN